MVRIPSFVGTAIIIVDNCSLLPFRCSNLFTASISAIARFPKNVAAGLGQGEIPNVSCKSRSNTSQYVKATN